LSEKCDERSISNWTGPILYQIKEPWCGTNLSDDQLRRPLKKIFYTQSYFNERRRNLFYVHYDLIILNDSSEENYALIKLHVHQYMYDMPEPIKLMTDCVS